MKIKKITWDGKAEKFGRIAARDQLQISMTVWHTALWRKRGKDAVQTEAVARTGGVMPVE
jgi:hypothetical protein